MKEKKYQKEFAKVFRDAAEKYRETSKSADLVENFILPALYDANFYIIKETILSEILSYRKEIFHNSSRLNYVSTEKIVKIFKNHGMQQRIPF